MRRWRWFVSIAIVTLFKLNICCAQIIYIYDDEGASPNCVQQTKHLLQIVAPSETVQTINASEVIRGEWMMNAKAIIMPGGEDSPYYKKLDNVGNRNIKTFVERGGVYIGFCAGAYYGSEEINFYEEEDKCIDVARLAFFPGKAIGPVLAPYDMRGARAATIHFDIVLDPFDPGFGLDASLDVLFLGGPFFENVSSFSNATIVGLYDKDQVAKAKQRGIPRGKELPSIIQCTQGRGKALLSGVHFEFDPFQMHAMGFPEDVVLSLLKYDAQRLNLARTLLARLGLNVADKFY